MARRNSFWGAFFQGTRAAYRAQHAARTIRAWASGSPKRVVRLYERRWLYGLFARVVNRILR